MFTELVSDTIDPGALTRRVGAPRDGAVLVFLGVVRDHNDGRPVSGLEYEAYGEMAKRVLHEIAAEAAELLGTDRIAVVHRVGALDVGDVSVAIAVSSPHRAQAYEASRYVIEEIKKRLPVWKQEHYVDGGRSWLPGHTPEPTVSGPQVPATGKEGTG